jgi:hypothetical protein
MEGVQRYRIRNLPDNFPGLYDLGVACAADEGVRSQRHDARGVVVVYLGQADIVRARLQQYGRSGSHLDTDLETSDHLLELDIALLHGVAEVKQNEGALKLFLHSISLARGQACSDHRGAVRAVRRARREEPTETQLNQEIETNDRK